MESFTKEELVFMADCLISYQAMLLNVSKYTFGNLGTECHKNINRIAELNSKLCNEVEKRKD